MGKTLYLSPPSFDGFDGGAGARYQARREVTSYWYPTWLAQPAALTPGSRLLDCPPHNVDLAQCLAIAKDYDHVIINTSTPSLKNDCKVAEAIKQALIDAATFRRVRLYDKAVDTIREVLEMAPTSIELTNAAMLAGIVTLRS